MSGGRFATVVFRVAAVYGCLVLLPQYFFPGNAGSRPEQFYGFIGVALAWQFVFFMVSRDVMRYRGLMLPSILEKLLFGIPVVMLFFQDRVDTMVLAAGCIDLLLALLFALAWWRTGAVGAANEHS